MENNNNNANRPEYIPQPVDVSNVKLDEGIDLLVERLACNFHDVWGKQRAEQGWGYGPVRDDANKFNPCMVYYDELTEEQKEDDRRAAIDALKFIDSKGYTIVRRKKPDMADVRRMAWTDHGRSEEKVNYDATVFFGVFGTKRAYDEEKLRKALREFYVSVHELFGQKNAAIKKNYSRYSRTNFAILSPLETESEKFAARVAADYGIKTYKVVRGAQTSESDRIIGVQGDVTDEICDSSLFALAMWDGIKGSSGEERMNTIVERALKGSDKRLSDLDMPDNITVFHLMTPEKAGDTGSASHKVYTVRRLHPYPLESGNTWFYRGGISRAKKTDEYNRERFMRCVSKIANFNEKVRTRREAALNATGVGDLMPGLHGHTASDRNLLRHLYTDNISYSAQKRQDKLTKRMIIAAVIGLGAYSLLSDAPEKLFGLNLEPFAPILGGIIIAALTIAMLIFLHQRKTGSQDEYVDFRLISECLRVQTYWDAAGIGSSVEDEFSAKSKLDFEWARYILRSWQLSDTLYCPESRSFPKDIDFEISRIWFGREDMIKNGRYRHEKDECNKDGAAYQRLTGNVDQYGFTRNKAEDRYKKARFAGILQVASIAVAYGLTILVGVLVMINALAGGGSTLIDYIALLASIVQIVVAGYNLYADTKDYERLANTNKWLSIEYQKAIIAFSRAKDREQRLEVFRKVGGEAVREVCGWALDFSSNEPGSPIS